jgi:AraC-like DNA-binding protein
MKFGEQALDRGHRSRGVFRASVENAIVPLLPHGKARADIIARELGLSARTLARRLEAEGQVFSSVVRTLREDLARRYLAEKELSISQIAWLLGYREVGAFSHAFKRMTGKTPREFRAGLD